MPSLLDNFQDPEEQVQQPKKALLLDSFEDGLDAEQSVGPDAPVQAAISGFGQTATLGYLPQLQAMAGSMIGDPNAALDERLRAQGFTVQGPASDYVSLRDQHIKDDAALGEANPMANFAGKAAGIGASMLAPMGGAAKGVGALAKAGNAARVGAIQGAIYNPGDEQGKYAGVMGQIPERLGNAAIGAAVGGAMSGASSGVKALADKSRMVDRVKDSAGLSKSVKQEIDAALNNVSQKQIKPKADALRELIKGKEVAVAPERLKGVSPRFDKLVDKLASRGQPTEGGKVNIAAKNAQRVKRLMDNEANYARSKPFDTAASARGETAKSAADVLRNKIAEIDPRVGQLNSEMGEAIRLRDALARSSATAPISSIRTQAGTDKGSLIDSIDKMAGSNLESLSSRIEDARGLLLKPTNLVKPFELSNEVRKLVVRGTAGAARPVDNVLDKLPEETRTSLIRALMESKR
jgi:hypothetical protein